MQSSSNKIELRNLGRVPGHDNDNRHDGDGQASDAEVHAKLNHPPRRKPNPQRLEGHPEPESIPQHSQT